MAENSSLFGVKQKQLSYGSTRKLDNTNEYYIKHCVTSGETLAGICLKYGVQVQHIADLTLDNIRCLQAIDLIIFYINELLYCVGIHVLQTEAVKRINKLWTNDSLFVRDFILIPVLRPTCKDGACSNGNESNLSQDVASVELLSRQDVRTLQSSLKPTASLQDSALQSSSAEPTVNDFLSRVDSSLNQLRVHVNNLDKHTE